MDNFDSKTDVSDSNGNYILAIDRPQPDALIYVGIFGRDLGLIPLGQNYIFSVEVMTEEKFKNYVSSPYVGTLLISRIVPLLCCQPQTVCR